ncbi:carbohydrate ABC transporter permease [Planosporangium sp. 12N6]|uniref:carbohydrate ABC transporter permease n=1 Tax=Planosporangium spinosum TaxID=3402278 RepID=UPI003CE72124
MSIRTAPPVGPPATRVRVSTVSHRRSRYRLTRWDVKYSPYLYVAPFFVVFGVFGAYPLLYNAWVSLHDWNLIGDHTFVGLRNYGDLIVDDDFWNSVVNTIGIFVVATVPQMVLALLLANILNRNLRGRTVFRMGVLVPNITSVAAVAIVFGQMFARDFGMVNYVLHFFGVGRTDWQADKWSSWIAISTMVDWRWTGYNALIFLAAMQAIPRDLYEAAAIDGASRMRQFWSITVPMLRPTIIFAVIISTIGGLQLFTEPLLFGYGRMQGGSQRQFQTVTMYMYENAFQRFHYGYGAAIAWLLFLLIAVVCVVNYLIVRRTAR